MSCSDTENLQYIADAINVNLLKHNLSPEISFRLKDPYSILKKMIRKNLSIQELTDIIAFRVILPSTEDCYRALDVINRTYEINKEKIKDFINQPKGNGYQSLHVVIANVIDKRSMEIQIRTRQMHDIAEFGAANHDEYKKRQEERIKRLFHTVKSHISLRKAYIILKKFNWTLLDLISYEQEINKLWFYCKINSLRALQKEFENEDYDDEMDYYH